MHKLVASTQPPSGGFFVLRRNINHGLFMSLTETKTPSIVLIEWCDASHEFGWQDGNEVSNEEPNLTCFSVGWLLVKTKTHIKLCQTYASENHAQTLIIPAGMIRSITVLKPSVVRNGNKGK